MPAKSPAAEPDPAGVSDPAATVKEDLGQPVHHVRTGKLVGYLTSGKFTPIEELRSK
ncbi:hypothetical protein GCM10018966_072570 [Streptomyces yanii]